MEYLSVIGGNTPLLVHSAVFTNKHIPCCYSPVVGSTTSWWPPRGPGRLQQSVSNSGSPSKFSSCWIRHLDNIECCKK